MSIRHYCDHCRKETNPSALFKLDDRDFIDSSWEDTSKFRGFELCKACYYERLEKHINLDLDFFGVGRDEA